MNTILKLSIGLFIACLSLSIQAQVSSQNYIRTRTMLNTQATDCQDIVQYYDGLGRPFLQLSRGVTHDMKNLVVLQEYDPYGRESDGWLPIKGTDVFMTPESVKSAALTQHSNQRPYSRLTYEASPLNRVLQEYGVGAEWANKPVKTNYLVNTLATPLNCKKYYVNSVGGLAENGMYAAGELQVLEGTDEDGHRTYSFSDKLQRTVLARQMNGSMVMDTYYVYDDCGNLCFVLQPMYQDLPNLSLYGFQYTYDSRNRCTRKRLPGCGLTSYMYDKADNLIYSQDSIQKNNSKWKFYLYDNLKRPVLEGICKDPVSVANTAVTVNFTASDTGIGQSGYSANINFTVENLQMVNYYDNYDFRALSGFKNNTAIPAGSVDAKGQLTGGVTSLLGSATRLYSARYYDLQGRVLKSVSSNHLGGYDTTNFTYTFSSKPLTMEHIHSGLASLTEVYTYSYDHVDRPLSVTYRLNQDTVTLATYVYDDWGRLVKKNQPGNNGSYTYNIRNWITGITQGKFSQNLYYNTGSGTACYNGNISSMTWKLADETFLRGYKFAYDGSNRLTSATYGEGNTIAATGSRNYTELISGYSKNSAITNLQRYGKTNSGSYGLIDNLHYDYKGNQLKAVSDAVTDPTYAGAFNFVNGANTATEYAYDFNGNLTRDDNKKITSIIYNLLNLPQEITFSNGNKIVYLYAASGEKLRATYTVAGVNTTYDYCGNLVFKNNAIAQVSNEEGYATLSGNTPTFHYYQRDHLGNNRLVTNSSGNAEQVTHYYAFGGVFGDAVTNADLQRYKYNDKELDRTAGLDWYDYGARHYDAALGMFMTVDPMAEKYYGVNQYAYCLNNPVNAVDPDGRSTWVIRQSDGCYKVVGGNLANDDKNIYAFDLVDGELVNRGAIGVTPFTTSFYDSDVNYGRGAWAYGSIIDPNDKSGERFLGEMKKNDPPMFDDYMANAGNGGRYDFKKTNGTDKEIKGINVYRGMSLGKTPKGQNVYTSARDIGNIAAGYIAGSNGMPWKASRIAFDAYQAKASKGEQLIEGRSTRNAEYLGWVWGSNTHPFKKAENLRNSINSGVKSIWD